MTTSVPVRPEPASHGGSLFPSSRMLTLRGMRSIRRIPSTFIPALAMPIAQSIAFSGTFFALTKIPGFPTDRSINWFLPLGAIMGSSFSGVSLGFSAIRDIETGFYDRLRMAPMPRFTLLLAPLMVAVIRTLIVVTIVLGVGLCFGARPTDWAVGIPMFYVACLGMAIVSSGWGLGLAFRFRDMRGAALMQLTLFLVMFTSSAQAPMSIMRGWLLHVARINPATNILRLARQAFLQNPVGGVTWDHTYGGLIALACLAVATTTFAYTGLRTLDR